MRIGSEMLKLRRHHRLRWVEIDTNMFTLDTLEIIWI